MNLWKRFDFKQLLVKVAKVIVLVVVIVVFDVFLVGVVVVKTEKVAVFAVVELQQKVSTQERVSTVQTNHSL